MLRYQNNGAYMFASQECNDTTVSLIGAYQFHPQANNFESLIHPSIGSLST